MRFIVVLLSLLALAKGDKLYNKVECRDPDLGGHTAFDRRGDRKLVLVHGEGAGIGNFLVFFPAAYYFAALTGRDLAIMDKSLIADMCRVIVCGFPLQSDMIAAYPHLKRESGGIEGAKVPQFREHFLSKDTKDHVDSVIVRADGYKYMGGWYTGMHENITNCIQHITGCEPDDDHCHDRHALKRLLRGPFMQSALTAQEEQRIMGVPQSLKHAILSLPHAFAPRLDAAIHLRCQFSHFEMSVGRDDGSMWDSFVEERNTWLNSTKVTDPNHGGQHVFRLLTEKLMEQVPMLRKKAKEERERRRRRLARYLNVEAEGGLGHGLSWEQRRRLEELMHPADADDKNKNKNKNKGGEEERLYVYVASDNEEVKERMVAYLEQNAEVPVAAMRVINTGEIAHAKNAVFFHSVANHTGPVDLTVDWYALSLSSVIFAWRRGTGALSTFAQSAQHMSGNTERSDYSKAIGHGMGSVGLQLWFQKTKDGWIDHWKYFF